MDLHTHNVACADTGERAYPTFRSVATEYGPKFDYDPLGFLVVEESAFAARTKLRPERPDRKPMPSDWKASFQGRKYAS